VLDLFYIVIGIGFLLSLMVQGWLRMTYGRWSKVRNSLDMPGANVARFLLDKNGMPDRRITMQRGALTDHYDPRNKTVSLSQRIFTEPSVASAAVAAHETGHAIQDKVGYGPMRLRYKLLPIAQLSAQYGPWAIMGGYFFGSSSIILVGFLMFAGALMFQLLTLPIEFDASRRAKDELAAMGFNTIEDREGAKKVLRAAAMTYVANAATAMGQLLVIMLIFGRSILGRFGATR
jgi:Zn-dependent membrane protease YugP